MIYIFPDKQSNENKASLIEALSDKIYFLKFHIIFSRLQLIHQEDNYDLLPFQLRNPISAQIFHL